MLPRAVLRAEGTAIECDQQNRDYMISLGAWFSSQRSLAATKAVSIFPSYVVLDSSDQ